MKKLIIIFSSILFFNFLNAQTGICTTTPNASAKLDVFSNNKGFLPPRVSLTDINDQTTIASPATGLLVYCKGDAGLTAGYYYWNGNAWATIATPGGSGSFASSYLRGSRTATQTLNVNDNIIFNNVDNSAGINISLNTTTGKITLAAGNTYRIRGAVPNFSSGQRPSFIWYNETTSSNIGSATFAYNPGDGAALGAFGAPAELIITPNVSTVISLRLLSSLSSGSVTVGGNVDFSTTGSYPWFDIQVISGNAPVTGQTVEYGIVKYTGSETAAMTTGSIVQFDATASGNLSWSANKFTLKANKTYELESYLSIYQSAGGVAGVFQIYDYTNSAALANGFYISINGAGSYNPSGNGPMRAIVTPTSDITVGIKFVSYYGPGAPGLIGSTNIVGANAAANQCYFMVKQIGSSAIVDPWVLSGNNTYNTTGNVGIGTNAPTQALDVTGNVNVTGKINLTDPTGNVATKAAGFVDAGTYVTLDNVRATVNTSGSRGLGLATVTGSFSAFINGTYTVYTGGTNGQGTNLTVTTTTASSSLFGWNFVSQGDASTYIVNDITNKRIYRITLMIGGGYYSNLITIERLL
jgi:hypothetical protein